VNQNKSNYSSSNWELVSINPNEKNWDWIDLFFFWGNNIQSIIAFSLIGSLYLIYDLNVFVVLLGSLIGSLFVYFFANLIGKPSQKYGLPFPVILRTSLGVKGAKYFALIRGLVGIFMFGIQTYFLSKLFSYIIRIFIFSIDNTLLDQEIFLVFLLGLNIIDWAAFILAVVLQAFLFSKSQNFNRSIIKFSAIVVYSGMLLFFLVVLLYDVKTVSAAFADIFSLKNVFEKDNITPLITVAGTTFAYFSAVIVNYGDFSRYVKNENELKKGNFSLILNLLLFSFFAVFIVIGSDIFLNKNLESMERILTNPTDIIGKVGNIQISIIVLFFIIFASVSTNLIANYIPTQNVLLNFLPTKLNIKSTAVVISIFAFIIGIFWLPLLSQIGILAFIDTLAAFFGPLFGVMVIDYYLIKKTKLTNKDIFSLENDNLYFYSNGWHIKAIYSLVLGFIFAASTIWNDNLMNFHSFSWIIGGFISSLTYYLLASK
jgi:nucleobase:cation symporter-1, NCS1 family|tara:strand:+ start:362 stop:1819 length:1458 start_codon:yes stop_codon:yes gene_type:complete